MATLLCKPQLAFPPAASNLFRKKFTEHLTRAKGFAKVCVAVKVFVYRLYNLQDKSLSLYYLNKKKLTLNSVAPLELHLHLSLGNMKIQKIYMVPKTSGGYVATTGIIPIQSLSSDSSQSPCIVGDMGNFSEEGRLHLIWVWISKVHT